jgi:membrane protease YdiL (CAAX protease family)
MAYDADANRIARRWLALLVIPWIAMIWVPSYNRVDPQLWGFPFFYWYQLLWVLIGAAITALVYFKTKDIWKRGTGQREGGEP